jgi:hypothetical protein
LDPASQLTESIASITAIPKKMLLNKKGITSLGNTDFPQEGHLFKSPNQILS